MPTVTFPADLPAAAILVTLLAALLAGLARGFSGFGAAMIFVPLVAAALGPVVAMPILLIADAATASPMIVRATRQCDWFQIRRVAVGGLAGVPIGAYILTSSDPIAVRWAVTALIAISLGLMLSGWNWRIRHTQAEAVGVGLASGLMSGLAQIGGPPIVMYWLAAGLEPKRMRANLIVYFAVLMWTALLIFALKGLLGPKVWWLALLTAPAYAAGMWIGSAMFGLATAATFRAISIGLIALATLLGMPALDGVLGWGSVAR